MCLNCHQNIQNTDTVLICSEHTEDHSFSKAFKYRLPPGLVLRCLTGEVHEGRPTVTAGWSVFEGMRGGEALGSR